MPQTAYNALLAWVEEFDALTTPKRVEWCDGSAKEHERLCRLLVDNGTFTRLDTAKRPNSYWARSDPRDVARVETQTFGGKRCTETSPRAGQDHRPWPEPALGTAREGPIGSGRGTRRHSRAPSLSARARPLDELQGLELSHQVARLGERARNDRFGDLEELEDPGIGHRVADRRTLLPSPEDASAPQDAKLLG